MAFVSDFPVLVAEFDVARNVLFDLSKVPVGSKKVFWWVCGLGHGWDSSVASRVRGGKVNVCPVCSGRRILVGFNDLASTHPELAEEWHPTRNGVLLPVGFSHGSTGKVWWLGKCGHEWEATVGSRAKGSGCPVCAGQKVLVGFNDLATTHPEIAAQWHLTRNGELSASDVRYGSRRKVWWLGECGHEWEAPILNRVNGNGCYQCLKRSKASPAGLLVDDEVLFNELHPSKNVGCDVSSLKRFSVKRVWWLGRECGHEWESSVSSRSMGSGCPFCAGNKVKEGFNDLGSVFPELAAEWHLVRNGKLVAAEVVAGSRRKVWWQCGKGHEWEAAVSDRTGRDKTGCPFCSNRKVLAGFNDLATTHPELVEEWSFVRNGDVVPESVIPGSKKRVWWVCGKGHEWIATCENRTNAKSGCPSCSAKVFVSRAEQEIADYLLSLGLNVATTVRDIIKGELDIYVPEKDVAVEFNGLYWHSEKFKNKTYHYDKWKACKDKGVQLIQVWEDDWNHNPELVKRMLVHKLQVNTLGKVYARLTVIHNLSALDAKEFLVGNHLQGYRSAKYFGLKMGDELVAVLGVARKGDEGLEIIRFATSKQVVGGFSKLLNHVLNQEMYSHVKKVFSYSHNDHSDGGVYSRNGFELVHEGTPGYYYWSNGWKRRQFRLNYSPSRIKTNSSLIYKEGASERELAELNGLVRVWDSGSSLWVKKV